VKPSVKYQVIYKHRDKYGISEMCRFFNVSRSGYYKYLNRKDRPDKDIELANQIRECQDFHHKTYGYRIQTKAKLTPLEKRCQYVA